MFLKGENYERYHSGRRLRHPSVSADQGNIQAVASDLRQAYDLLSAVRSYERRHPGDPDHLYSGRHAAI